MIEVKQHFSCNFGVRIKKRNQIVKVSLNLCRKYFLEIDTKFSEPEQVFIWGDDYEIIYLF